MKEIVEFLNANPMGSLATVENNKPQLRPWGFMFEQDGKLWFCTANTKPVFKQLKNNPAIAFCSTSKEMVTVRITGSVHFSQDPVIKQTIISHSDLVKSIYQTADNPIFEAFCVEHGEATLSDFSGNPPKKFTF